MMPDSITGFAVFAFVVAVILLGIEIVREYMAGQEKQKNKDNNNGHKDWR